MKQAATVMDGKAFIEQRAAQANELPGPQQAAEPNVAEFRRMWPDPLSDDALHGLPGEITRIIEPHSESDPAALLIQLLVGFGSAVGRAPHFTAEADRHGVNLFAMFVGETSKARKGTSWGHAKRILVTAEPEWEPRIASGLSSGEGLIWQVCDPIERQEAIKEKGKATGYEIVTVDGGISDKRLLVFEGEFAATLRVLGREGNTLSAILRNAWDTGSLSTLTKNSPARATGAHISIIGHITRHELLRYLEDAEAANGFANRFLWACVQRSKSLPEGGNLQWASLAPLETRLREAINFARNMGELRRDDRARAIWHEVYHDLSEGRPGLLGAMTARAEAQVMRLACVYSLLDRSHLVCKEHLLAALGVWEYCEASARFIFGERLGDPPTADTLLDAVRPAPEGLTRTEISILFGRHKKAEAVERTLIALRERGLIHREVTGTEGRPVERWSAGRHAS
jgi:hypothetical protein